MRQSIPRESSSIEIPPSGLLFKLTLTEALKEIATSISKQARLNDEHAIDISLNYFHFMIIISLNIVKKGY